MVHSPYCKNLWARIILDNGIRARKQIRRYRRFRTMSLLQELQQDAAVLYEERYEDERQNGRQLDQDVQRRAGRVLQRIAHRRRLSVVKQMVQLSV